MHPPHPWWPLRLVTAGVGFLVFHPLPDLYFRSDGRFLTMQSLVVVPTRTNYVLGGIRDLPEGPIRIPQDCDLVVRQTHAIFAVFCENHILPRHDPFATNVASGCLVFGHRRFCVRQSLCNRLYRVQFLGRFILGHSISFLRFAFPCFYDQSGFRRNHHHYKNIVTYKNLFVNIFFALCLIFFQRKKLKKSVDKKKKMWYNDCEKFHKQRSQKERLREISQPVSS